MVEEMPRELARCLAAGTRNPMPRGQCPRCGHNVALLRDRSRTILHGCVPHPMDAIAAETRGNATMFAIEMATGAIVLDPEGTVATVYQRWQSLEELRARLRDGAANESLESVIEDLKALPRPDNALWLDVDEVTLIIVSLARQSLADPASESRCRELAHALWPSRIDVGRGAFDAFRRVLAGDE
jgi:hypothetical protein